MLVLSKRKKRKKEKKEVESHLIYAVRDPSRRHLEAVNSILVFKACTFRSHAYHGLTRSDRDHVNQSMLSQDETICHSSQESLCSIHDFYCFFFFFFSNMILPWSHFSSEAKCNICCHFLLFLWKKNIFWMLIYCSNLRIALLYTSSSVFSCVHISH